MVANRDRPLGTKRSPGQRGREECVMGECSGMPRGLYEALRRNNQADLEAMGQGDLYDPEYGQEAEAHEEPPASDEADQG